MKHMLKVVMVLAASALVVLAGCSSTQESAPSVGATNTGELSFDPAPSFEVETIEGKIVNSEEYKSQEKPMVVYFMASTCSTCAKNWKNIDEVYPEYKDRVDLIAVSVDPTDSKEVLQKLADEKGFTFETVAGNPQLAVDFAVTKQTAKFAIDGEGNILSRHDGLLSPEEWRELFESVA